MPRNLWLAVTAMLLSQTLVAHAEAGKRWDDQKPAWQWTTEERLAKRFDRAERKDRAAAENVRLKELRELGMPGIPAIEPFEIRSDQDGINGERNPELFLQHELFDHLLMDAFPPDGRHQQITRGFLQERAAALGFGADLWQRLGRVASPYLELRRERDRLAWAEHQDQSADRRLSGSLAPDVLCRTRAQVLATAKQEFGEEAFLRLLYEGVAPRLGVAYLLGRDLEENLRRQEGGCP